MALPAAPLPMTMQLLGMPNLRDGLRCLIYGTGQGHLGKSRYLIYGTGRAKMPNLRDGTEKVPNLRDRTEKEPNLRDGTG